MHVYEDVSMGCSCYRRWFLDKGYSVSMPSLPEITVFLLFCTRITVVLLLVSMVRSVIIRIYSRLLSFFFLCGL